MSQKYYLKSVRKGHLQIDFTFAMAVFFLFLFLVFSYYNSYYSSQQNSLDEFRLNANARDICFLLVNSEGSPSNWESDLSSLNFVGLKNSSNNVLNSFKILAFNNTDYFTIIDSLGINSFLFLKITGVETNTKYLTFGSDSNVSYFSSKYSCYGVYNDEPVKIFVEVWK